MIEQKDLVTVNINFDNGQRIAAPVKRKVLARNMKELGLWNGQAKLEKEARLEHTHGDVLAVLVSLKEAFPKVDDLSKYLSH